MTSEFAIGVHALVYLNHKKETISSEALAQNVCTNPARIRKVLAKLKLSGLVSTREGLGGGYQIDKPADKISLRDVCDSLNEKLIKASWKSGSAELKCLVASGMAPVMDDIYEELNSICLDSLQKITIDDIDHKIFKDRKNYEHISRDSSKIGTVKR